MKKLLSATLAVMLLVLAVAPAMAISIRGVNPGDKLYVTVNSSTTLNLRETPSTKGKVIAKLKRGTAVIAQSEYQAPFLLVAAGNKVGFVDIRYLDAKKPSSGGGSTTPTEETLVSKVSFKSFKLVTNVLIVTPKPSRVGGSVNLRWIPSLEASALRKAYAGDELRVITEGKDWYQVQTTDGYVVYIAKKYTSVVYSGDGTDYVPATK